jgi:hypothetical protein
MIKSVKITSLREASSMPYKSDVIQNVWISVVDPECDIDAKKLGQRFSKLGIKHFYQIFRDWSDEDRGPNYSIEDIETHGPKISHINNIISFLEPIVTSDVEYHLGVNCFAGVSRSTAVGMIAWIMQGNTPKEALDKILAVRSCAWPNLRILRLASPRLEVDAMGPVKEWMKEQETKLYTLDEKFEE